MKMGVDLIVAAGLALSGVVLGSALPTSKPNPPVNPKTVAQTSQATAPTEPVEQIGEAEYMDVLNAIDSPEIELIDARDITFYAKLTIPSARNIPKGAAKTEKQRKKSAIVFCSGSFCGDAKRVAEELRQAGWKNLRVYPGGMEEWKLIRGIN